LSKIRQYFSTFEITRGLLVSLFFSTFIYLDYWGLSSSFINTILGLTALYLLLQEDKKVWFFSGAFIGLFWFWWIILSFKHYEMLWAIPIGLFFISLVYGLIFWLISYIAEKISLFVVDGTSKGSTRGAPQPTSLILKSLGLLGLSYMHPMGFDWLKPELIFIESYLGIEKWQFAIVLLGITLSIWKKNFLFLFIIIFAYQAKQSRVNIDPIQSEIKIIAMHTTVKDKWNKALHPKQFEKIFKHIDKAIDENKTLIILPESVFPIFLNRSQELIDKLQKKSKYISIILGGLYWDGETPRNSTYIFTNNEITVANKVLLVPFGESNPLPDFLSDWVNKVFYDDSVDYKASPNVIDYEIDGETYRNAICFEATSEKLYAKDKNENYPKNMIVLSNNGWFVPSIEPTLQKLLLQYYSQKYGTIIYHAANMSKSYVITNGKVEKSDLIKNSGA